MQVVGYTTNAFRNGVSSANQSTNIFVEPGVHRQFLDADLSC
jgi:hypothetical protein